MSPSDIIHKWTLAPQVDRFQNGVEPGHWGGHQVSGHETDMSNYVLTEVGRFHIGALTVVEPTSAYF